AARSVSPQDVGFAIAVEVADGCHGPCGIGDAAHEALRDDLQPVHEIDVIVAGGGVPPQDVASAVAVEVADAGDRPVGIGDRADIAFAGQDVAAVHEIDVVLSGRGVPPQDVGRAVAVEVTQAGDRPG